MADVCPHCGNSHILARGKGYVGRPSIHETRYYCDTCGAHFDEPAEGDAHEPTGDGVGNSATARQLLNADPDIDLRGGGA